MFKPMMTESRSLKRVSASLVVTAVLFGVTALSAASFAQNQYSPVSMGSSLNGVALAQISPDTNGVRRGERTNGVEQQKRQQKRQQKLSEMGITPEQMQQMKQLREQNRAKSKAMRQEVRTKQKAVMQYIQSPNAKESQAMAMQRDVAALQSEMHAMRIRSAFQMREILGPEAFQKLAARRKQMKEKRGQRQGGRHQRRQGRRGRRGGSEGGSEGPQRRWQPGQ